MYLLLLLLEGAQQEIITSLAPIIIISILEQTVFNTAYLV